MPVLTIMMSVDKREDKVQTELFQLNVSRLSHLPPAPGAAPRLGQTELN
jgi:hypothetical protein